MSWFLNTVNKVLKMSKIYKSPAREQNPHIEKDKTITYKKTLFPEHKLYLFFYNTLN